MTASLEGTPYAGSRRDMPCVFDEQGWVWCGYVNLYTNKVDAN